MSYKMGNNMYSQKSFDALTVLARRVSPSVGAPATGSPLPPESHRQRWSALLQSSSFTEQKLTLAPTVLTLSLDTHAHQGHVTNKT